MKKNEIIELTDTFSVSEHPRYKVRGVVEAFETKTGKKLFTQENMIVKSGRTLIFNTLFDNGTFDRSKLKAYISTDGTPSNENMTYETYNASSKPNGIIKSKPDAAGKLVTNVVTKRPVDNVQNDKHPVADLSILFTIVIGYNDLKNIFDNSGEYVRSLALVYVDNPSDIDNSTKTLFSRVVFPQYSVMSESITLKYTIYF